jgi:hypothetical protein
VATAFRRRSADALVQVLIFAGAGEVGEPESVDSDDAESIPL